MGRKVIALWLCFTMMFGFIVFIIRIAPIVEAPTTWFVDDVPGDGGPGDPPEDFISIQDAINAAIDGDTVFVYNGTYNERIVVNKTINLTGEGRRNTILDGGSPLKGDVVKITEEWVNITGLTITGCGADSRDAGMALIDINYIRVINCNVSSNRRYGIYLDGSSNINITGTNFSSNFWDGVYISSSTNITLSNNNFVSDGIFIDGIQLSHYNSHNISVNNIVNGKPLYYFKDTSGIIIDGVPIGQLILANCTDFNVTNLHMNNTDVGIEIAYSLTTTLINNNVSDNWYGITQFNSSNSRIIGNNVSDNVYGIWIESSTNNIIFNNSVLRSHYGIYCPDSSKINITYNNVIRNTYGILLSSSSNCIITGNNASKNTGNGIRLLSSSNNNTIASNYIWSNSWDGIVITSSSNNNIIKGNNVFSNKYGGISNSLSSYNKIFDNNVSSNPELGIEIISSSSYNNVANNNVWNSDYGLSICGSSNNNSIVKNNVSSNNGYGIYVFSANDNRIYHNNIMSNLNQAFDNGNNQWDDGYPSGGNFWSDYNGVDFNSTPSQNIPPPDGIGDTPYVIDSDSKDNYPFISPIKNCSYLYEGWNFISIPFTQSNTHLDTVLYSITGSYDVAQWYNANEKSDHWKHNNTKKSYLLNDLDSIDHIRGFWIHIIKPGGVLFQYPGTRPIMNQTISLHPGWNMVGYPSLTSYNRTEGLNNLTFDIHIDAIWTYNAPTQKYKELTESDYFEPGSGYYIHAKEECTWVVPL